MRGSRTRRLGLFIVLRSSKTERMAFLLVRSFFLVKCVFRLGQKERRRGDERKLNVEETRRSIGLGKKSEKQRRLHSNQLRDRTDIDVSSNYPMERTKYRRTGGVLQRIKPLQLPDSIRTTRSWRELCFAKPGSLFLSFLKEAPPGRSKKPIE